MVLPKAPIKELVQFKQPLGRVNQNLFRSDVDLYDDRLGKRHHDLGAILSEYHEYLRTAGFQNRLDSANFTSIDVADRTSFEVKIEILVLLQFNRFTVLVGIASLGVVAIYPLMKRIIWWPQIVLGLAFSWGALMGWAAVFSRLDAAALLLYAGSIAWVIGYDTIYAHQDREDDALVGVKSTARLFGARTRLALVCFYTVAVLLIGLSGAAAGAGPVFVLGCILFGAHLGWQVDRLDIDDPELCLRLFKSNRDAGLILFAALIADAVYQSYFV